MPRRLELTSTLISRSLTLAVISPFHQKIHAASEMESPGFPTKGMLGGSDMINRQLTGSYESMRSSHSSLAPDPGFVGVCSASQ